MFPFVSMTYTASFIRASGEIDPPLPVERDALLSNFELQLSWHQDYKALASKSPNFCKFDKGK